jgi:hypothetical protein
MAASPMNWCSRLLKMTMLIAAVLLRELQLHLYPKDQ